MLPLPIRFDLRSEPDFFQRAQRRSAKGFGLWWVTPKETSPALPDSISPKLQLAIIVSKKHGGAVQRVKLKRQWRERLIALWHHSPTLFEVSHRVVVVPFGARVPSLEELENTFRSLLPNMK